MHLSAADFAWEKAEPGAEFFWDIGASGNFTPSRSGKISFQAPLKPKTDLACIVRITYPEGKWMQQSTIRIPVLLDAPEPRVSAPDMAYAGDWVPVSAAGSRDRFGRIVKWEWDFGNQGEFMSFPGPEARFRAPSRPQAEFPSVLRITDDDGNVRTHTFGMAIRERSK